VSTPGKRNVPSEIGLVAFDVDGVFTDGRFYLSDDGCESKAFNTQDGFGIRALLLAGVEVAVISGRSSKAVELRMAELGVTHVIQGCKDKVDPICHYCDTQVLLLPWRMPLPVCRRNPT